MKDILSEIIANKRFEVDLQKQAISIEQLQEGISEMPSSRSMKQALISSSPGIIAEFKRRSPSKGWIKQEARPEEIAPAYAAAGASALSILTDEKFFGGNLKDIRAARPLVDIPILRKDFIIDEYQLYQAKIVGADAVLLIAAALKPEKCNELVKKAHDLGLEVLLEIHSSEELTYINEKIDMVGINNRNLGTFFTDVENSFRTTSPRCSIGIRKRNLRPANCKTSANSRIPGIPDRRNIYENYTTGKHLREFPASYTINQLFKTEDLWSTEKSSKYAVCAKPKTYRR